MNEPGRLREDDATPAACDAVAGSRVWRLPADVDTDQLAPGATMKHGIDATAVRCLDILRPDFAAGVRRGDVIAAGANFGIGSSREQAVAVLLHLGIAAVIAPSFGGLYFRNAFNLGLLLLTCTDAETIEDGARLAIDARFGHAERRDGRALACAPVPRFLLDMVSAGGLLPQLKLRIEAASRKDAST